ncbi:hypothetical protein [Trichloromonas sp.]|uniref:hypothetical protein n=1 Tax=Trichloromonas sp. TaxID=3069249 RepID=UPI003D81694E
MEHWKQGIRLLLVLLVGSVLLLPASAQAKWWIFGQSNDEVELSYLYLNSLPYEESGPTLTLYKDLLPKGEVLVRGKTRVKRGKIGQIQVSIDDRQSWQEARFSETGAFEFRFRPEVGQPYILYVEVSDTAGKVNDVDATRKELIISDGRGYQVVIDALNELVEAYRAEDPARFMTRISPDFAGDATLLDRAIRRDFSAFDNIDLRFTLNNLAPDPRGRVFVSLTYSRFVISSRTGQSFSDKGVTEFVFDLGATGPAVYAMKNPLIFGLSDAANIATGTVAQSGGEPVLLVDSRGYMAVVPFTLFTQLVEEDGLVITPNADGSSTVATDDLTVVVTAQGSVLATSGGGGSVESGSNILIRSEMHPPTGFDFVSGEATEPPNVAFVITGGDEGRSTAYGFMEAGNTFLDLGNIAIGSVSEAPEFGYTGGLGYDFFPGHTYAFKLSNGHYALMEVKSVDFSYPPGWPAVTGYPSILMRIDYKYQPDGSRNF